jgi:hypothetical protein
MSMSGDPELAAIRAKVNRRHLCIAQRVAHGGNAGTIWWWCRRPHASFKVQAAGAPGGGDGDNQAEKQERYPPIDLSANGTVWRRCAITLWRPYSMPRHGNDVRFGRIRRSTHARAHSESHIDC